MSRTWKAVPRLLWRMATVMIVKWKISETLCDGFLIGRFAFAAL